MKKPNELRLALPSSRDLLHVAKRAIESAEAQGIKAAIAGGLALNLYGSPRLTADVDLVATSIPKGVRGRPLTFGGVSQKREGVAVDWIVRDDSYRALYEEALEQALIFLEYMLLDKPYLAAMKMVAARPKDEVDLLFLIPQMSIDERTHTKKIVRRLLGVYAAEDFARIVDEALWRAEKDR